MLNYRATPLSDSDNSPAELLFNRRLRTKLPVPVGKLVPTFADETRPQLVERQRKYKTVHDRHARDLPALKPGDVVRGDVVRVHQKSQLIPGEVVAPHQSPRSYVVKTEGGSTLRRNRRHLIKTKETHPDCRPPPLPTAQMTSSPTSAAPTSLPLAPGRAEASAPPTNPQPIPPPTLKTRSGRKVKLPVRLRDYVTS